MTLLHILVFSALALLVRWLPKPQWRVWAGWLASLLALFWLQPGSSIRNLDFWLPLASIGLTVLVWAITCGSRSTPDRAFWIWLLVSAAAVLALALAPYLSPICCLTASLPPQPLPVLLAAGVILVLLLAILRGRKFSGAAAAAAIFLILGTFVILKTPALTLAASRGLRLLSGQKPELAGALDIRWLGFSYLAFRLLHALRDFQGGRLPVYSLPEFATYALFFPTLTAGPIDRSQRFIQEDLRPLEADRALGSDVEGLLAGGLRIVMGVFKKFVLADSLALISLSEQSARQTASPWFTWLLLYAYAFRLYFDFAGYTDIALGIGRWLGFKLPENFSAPYLKPNLTAFWNSWHMTLATWFRAYFFNPVTRALRTSKRALPAWAVIFIGQMGTMLLIGLWHGVTWNFAAWGAWHGLGMFVHNRYSAWARPRLAGLEQRPRLARLLYLAGGLATFHYVALGWVWFALPNPALAIDTFRRLAGF